jgi:hypothetical protein
MKKHFVILIFIFLLLSFIISRLFILFTSTDLYVSEEMRIGMFAKELLSGSTIPYLALPAAHEAHQLGVLIDGVLMAGFFRSFGESGLIFKMCWLLFPAGTFLLLFYMLYKYFNQRVAIAASLLYIFPPPLFIYSNLTNASAESGAIFFTIAIMFLNYKMLFDENKKLRHFALYGFISGLAIFYSNYCILAVIVGIAYQALLNRSFFTVKSLFICGLFFGIGFSPWIYINWYYHLSWFSYLIPSRPMSLCLWWDKFAWLIFQGLPRSFFLNDMFLIKGINFGYLYLILSTLLFISACYVFRRPSAIALKKETFPYLFVVVYMFGYVWRNFKVVGNLRIGYRHFIILYPFMFMSLAIWTDKLLSSNKYSMKRLAGILFGLMLILGFVGDLYMVNFKNLNFKEPQIYKPYSFPELPYRVYNFTKGDASKLKGCILDIRKKYQPYTCRGIYKKIKIGFIDDPEPFLKDSQSIGWLQGSYYNGIGIGVGTFCREEPIFDTEFIEKIPPAYRLNEQGLLSKEACNFFLINPQALKKISASLNKDTEVFYYSGIGMSIGILKNSEIGIVYKFIDNFDGMLKRKLIEGFAAGLSIDRDMEHVIEVSQKFGQAYRMDFFRGAGFTFGLQTSPDINKIIAVGQLISQEYRGDYYVGIGKAVGWHFVNDPTLILKLAETDTKRWNFNIKEYSFLPIGLYKYLDDRQKETYCEGFGYGIAPYIFGSTAVVLSKYESCVLSKDYKALLRGICFYFHSVGSAPEVFDNISYVELGKKIKYLYQQIF